MEFKDQNGSVITITASTPSFISPSNLEKTQGYQSHWPSENRGTVELVGFEHLHVDHTFSLLDYYAERRSFGPIGFNWCKEGF